jgi:CHAD domain-containing protein
MKKKAEKAHFDDLWEHMTTHLKAFIDTGDQEQLHLFRVQVKKLRAMLMLLDINFSRHKLSKDFKPVRKIFKHCGEIRSAYINLQFGIRYQLQNEEFALNQVNAIEKGIIEFKQQAKKYLKKIKLSHNAINADLRTVDDASISEFYKSQLEQIARTLSNLKFNEELHKCRKQIKTLIYNRKIAHEALTDAKLQINNDYLDKLQENIGNWHDNILAIELFSTSGVNNKPVVTKIRGQNTRLKKSITLLAEGFWKKAISAGEGFSEHIKII